MNMVAERDESKFFIPDHVPRDMIHPFDLFADADIRHSPFDATQKMRGYGRVFWNPANPLFKGSWVLTEARDLRYVLSNPELFCSKGDAGFMTQGDTLELIPLELDPPRHGKFRQLLNPLITPAIVSNMTHGVTQKAVELIDAVADKGECDFMKDFALPFPVSIFMQLMGLPESETETFLGWVVALVQTGGTADDNLAMQAAAEKVAAYLTGLAAERRANPRQDIASYVANGKIDGEPLSDKEVLGTLYMLFLAGLDTVTATLGWFFYHLATHQDHQRQLREDPDLIPKAIEELLRRYSIVVGHRRCTRDVEVAGVAMKEGDWITVMQSMGSTDPAEFEDPLAVQFERQNIRHFAFAFGPHFCMGSHLARRELDVSLREFLARVPQFRIKAGSQAVTHGGHTFGFDTLPLEWPA